VCQTAVAGQVIPRRGSNPTAIVELLRDRDRSVRELADELPITPRDLFPPIARMHGRREDSGCPGTDIGNRRGRGPLGTVRSRAAVAAP
jgi:hypothetical protein